MISLDVMKRSFCVCLFTIALSASCYAEIPKLRKFDDLKFSIECPDGYEAKKYENTVSVLLSRPADNKSFKPNVTLSSAPNSNPPIGLDNFFNLVLQNFLKDANFNIVLAEKTKFKDRNVYQLIYKRTAALKDVHDNVISTKVLQVYMVDPSRVYVMNYSAAESDYDGYLAIANEIMKSFKIVEDKSTIVGKKSTIPEIPDVRY